MRLSATSAKSAGWAMLGGPTLDVFTGPYSAHGQGRYRIGEVRLSGQASNHLSTQVKHEADFGDADQIVCNDSGHAPTLRAT